MTEFSLRKVNILVSQSVPNVHLDSRGAGLWPSPPCRCPRPIGMSPPRPPAPPPGAAPALYRAAASARGPRRAAARPLLPAPRPTAPARVRGVLGAAAEGRGAVAAAAGRQTDRQTDMQRWGRVSCALARVRRRQGTALPRGRQAGRQGELTAPRLGARAWAFLTPHHPSPGAGLRAGGAGAGALGRARRPRGLAALPSRLCFRLFSQGRAVAPRPARPRLGWGDAVPVVSPDRRRASRCPRRGELGVLSLLPCHLLVLDLLRAEERCRGPQEASAGESGGRSRERGRVLSGCGSRRLSAVASRLLHSVGGFKNASRSILYCSYRMTGPWDACSSCAVLSRCNWKILPSRTTSEVSPAHRKWPEGMVMELQVSSYAPVAL